MLLDAKQWLVLRVVGKRTVGCSFLCCFFLFTLSVLKNTLIGLMGEALKVVIYAGAAGGLNKADDQSVQK